VRYASGTMPGSYGYTGQHADAATGLDYYVSGFYDPLAGQFISADTTLPGNGYDLWGLSRYAYVEGDPVGRADPTGHCPMCIGFVIGAVIGGAIEYGTQVYGNYQKGDPSPWTDVNMLQVGEAVLVGGVIGATGGLAGAAVGSALAETSAAVEIGGGIAAGAAIGAGEGAAGQVGDNLIHGRHWSDGVGQAALIGAVTGGIGGGAGAALSRYGGRMLRAAGGFTGAYNEGAADGGSGLGKLAGRSIQVSQKGLNRVKNHLSNPFFEEAPENQAVIGRLESAMANGRRVSGADASFYMHEVHEATLMRAAGYTGDAYAAAHQAALDRYGVSQFSVYHPDVIQQFSSRFGGAWRAFWRL
jgi:RHS repeat-associated protein